MASQSDLIKKAVQETFKQLEQIVPEEEYNQLNNDQRTELEQVAKEASEEVLKLVDDFSRQPDIAKHLSQDKLKKIEGSLEIPTFQLSITKQSDGKHLVQFTREGKELLPPRFPISQDDIDGVIVAQQASIFVEAEMLAMVAAGAVLNPPKPSDDTMRWAIEHIEQAIPTPPSPGIKPLIKVMETFVETWKEADKDPTKKVEAIFQLLLQIHQHNVFWKVGVYILWRTDNAIEKIKTIFRVTSTLLHFFHNQRGKDILKALITVAVLKNDKVITQKVDNIVHLSDIKKTL